MAAVTHLRSATELFGLPPAPKNGKERLIDVAVNLFYVQGFHAVGLDQVLESAGVTKTTFYKHFESKEDLIVECIMRRDEIESIAWQRAVLELAGEDPRAQLLAHFDVLDAFFNDPSFHGCIFANAASEFTDPRDPAHQAAAAHKQKVRDTWMLLAAKAGTREPGVFADRYTVLFEGALVLRHVLGRDDAAKITRPMVEALFDEHIPVAQPAL